MSFERRGESQINDLIFNEACKRGLVFEQGKPTLDLADSKLWYATEEQAEQFLRIERSPEYAAAVTEKEIALLREYVPLIIPSFAGEPLNLLDLGCGDGTKAVLCLEAFTSKYPLRYCPIDISGYMVQEAAHRVNAAGLAPVEHIFWNISDFENLENVTPLFRTKGYERHCLLLLGNTLGNFENDDILNGIKNAMRQGDALVIGNGLAGTRSPKEWIAAYSNEQVREFCLLVAQRLGLEESALEFSVEYIDGRIDFSFRIMRPQTIRHLHKTLSFEPGHIIRVIKSYKYGEEQLKTMLSAFFSNIAIYTDTEKTYALAACRL